MNNPPNVFYILARDPVVQQVPDGLEQWRLDHAMPRLLVIMEDHQTLIRVTEQVKDQVP